MHALMNLPNPKNEIKSLREFYDAIENHVRGLLALGWTTESYGALLVPMVLGKLPAETRKNLAREHGNLEWTINDSIAREIRVLEAGLCVPPSPAEDPNLVRCARWAFREAFRWEISSIKSSGYQLQERTPQQLYYKNGLLALQGTVQRATVPRLLDGGLQGCKAK